MIKNKIVTLAQLRDKVGSLKRSDKKIGFTNGCFDILHPGHIIYLEKAKDICDILIVGINSDSSIKKIKGKNRPIMKEGARLLIVAALESVDYVIKFSQKTPLNLIKSIKPDFLIKGGDWKEEDIVGSDYIKSIGGKVKIIPYVKGYSTTSLIKSILRRGRH